jgi:hypothetical protein
MKPVRFSVAISLSLVFLSGVLLGGLAHRFYLYTVHAGEVTRSARSADYRDNYIQGLRSRLKLSDDQVKRLGDIMDATRSRYREVHDKIRPELEAIHQQQIDQIEAALDPSQRAEYAKLRAERDKLREQREKGSR